MTPSEMDAHRGLLESSVVFKDVAASELLHIMERGVLLEAKQGDLVMFEHSRRVPGLYVVLEGQIEVFRVHETGSVDGGPSELYLNTLGPGQCFGEYSLIDGKNTSASGKARVDTRLFFLPRAEFLRVTDSDPQTGKTIYLNLLLFLIERLRQKDQELDVLIMR